MSCDCNSPVPSEDSDSSRRDQTDPHVLTDGRNPVVIQVPDVLETVLVNPGCTINASGTIDGLGLKLSGIFAKIGSGTEVPGTVNNVNYREWYVYNVPGALWNPNGYRQRLAVRGTFFAPAGQGDITNYQIFNAITGDGACYSPNPNNFDTITLLQITEIMPRHFRITGDFGGPSASDKIVGGLLSRSKVQLSYQPHLSTPECPIWRNEGSESGSGSWLLRVTLTQAGYEARLSFQEITETCVMPAITAMTRHWSFDDINMLHSVMEVGTAKTAVTLHVEPV